MAIGAEVVGGADEGPVVIVGAGAAGWTTAVSLREAGYEGTIALIGAEARAPYIRPPLSKQVLTGPASEDATALASPEEAERLRIDVRLATAATGLDTARRTVRLVDGGEVGYGTLVIATGVKSRRLSLAGGASGILYLREMPDAVTLHEALASGSRVAVIGAGVLGCEIACAAVALGCEVTVLSDLDHIRLGLAGGAVSDFLVRRLTQIEIDVRLATTALDVVETGGVQEVRLSDGSCLKADVVVASVGSVPCTEWLSESGLDVSNGVLCDPAGMAAERIFAVGDVARWTHAGTGEALRIEHQAAALDQARIVARRIVTGELGEPAPPFFWTDVAGSRVLVHGRPIDGTRLVAISGSTDGDSFVLAALDGDRAVGLIGCNDAAAFRKARAQMMSGLDPLTAPLQG